MALLTDTFHLTGFSLTEFTDWLMHLNLLF